MTNLQAFLKLAGDVSDNEARDLLEFDGIDPNGTWDPTNQTLKCGIYGAALNHLDQDGIGIAQTSEGGYSISYDRANKAKYMERLANDSGCNNLISKYRTKPVITDKSSMW